MSYQLSRVIAVKLYSYLLFFLLLINFYLKYVDIVLYYNLLKCTIINYMFYIILY